MNTMAKELTARKANKLALELQVILIRALTVALRYTFGGVSRLWGKVVDETDLQQAKNRLKELDRLQGIYDSEKYKQLPYLPSSITGARNVHRLRKQEDGTEQLVRSGKNTATVKAHFKTSGVVNFLEVKQNTRGKAVAGHLNTKQFTKKQLSTFNKNQKQVPAKKSEATNMATAKKATSKKANKVSKQAKKAASQPYAQKGKTVAQRIRDAYDKAPKGKFDKAEFAKKSGIPYNLVYGCITKYEAALAEGKAKKPAAKKAAAKKGEVTA